MHKITKVLLGTVAPAALLAGVMTVSPANAATLVHWRTVNTAVSTPPTTRRDESEQERTMTWSP